MRVRAELADTMTYRSWQGEADCGDALFCHSFLNEVRLHLDAEPLSELFGNANNDTCKDQSD